MPVKLRFLLAALLLVFLAVVATQPVFAQADLIRFASMQIDLWPEYDQTAVLVIYRIVLSADTPRPASIALRLPPTAVLHAVAVQDVDGQLLNVSYNEETDGDWKLVRFQATLPELQIEYYDSNLAKNGLARSFTYQWAGDYAVDKALAVVQQPFDGSSLSISPGPTTNQMSTDGLYYATKDIGSLAAAQPFQLDISYNKESDRVSVEFMEVKPLDNSTDAAPAGFDTQTWIIVLLVLVAIGLIVGGSFWYWRTTQETQPARRRRSRSTAAKSRQDVDESDSIYCHKCGRRAAATDRYCRGCGERLRT